MARLASQSDQSEQRLHLRAAQPVELTFTALAEGLLDLINQFQLDGRKETVQF